MKKKLLEIHDLHVSVNDANNGEKEILHGVNLEIDHDETHVLMGPNGTGKSTLGYAITGNPAYDVTQGEIIFNGGNITDMPVNERAKKGIFLSFQNPLEVPGVTLSSFIRSALEQKTGSRIRLWDFKKKLAETMKLLIIGLIVGINKLREKKKIDKVNEELAEIFKNDIITHPLAIIIALDFSVLLFLGTIIIGGRRARMELKRRFHIK